MIKLNTLPVLLTLMSLLIFPVSSHAAAAGLSFRQSDGGQINEEQLVKQLSDCDVVFFGEYHDSKLCHRAELELYKRLSVQNKGMALSLEMLERDEQASVNDYLTDRISEQAMLAAIRPWPNHKADYQPLIEVAKKAGRPVIAGNIPRRVAAEYGRVQDLTKITVADQKYLPQKHSVINNEYYDLFKKYMQSGPAGMKMNAARIEAFYKAQCLKDDTMAESIALYLNKHPGEKVFHAVGVFHSQNRLGVVEKLQLLRPDLKIGVVNSLKNDDTNRLQQNKAEYILLTDKNE